MIGALRVLGLIPARGGSKGVPRKNIRPLLGKPLIAYTIATARNSRFIDRVIVSTDDPEIRETAIREGAEAPFVRPGELATDTARAIPVIEHAVRFVEAEEGRRYDIIVYLEPPAPLRSVEDIDGAIAKFFESPCDSVISVTEVNHYHPIYMKKIVDDRIEPYCLEEPEGVPRQAFDPPAYIRNGAVYVCWRDNVIQRGTLRGNVSRPYVMPIERSVSIDCPIDWYVAEAMLRERG